MQNKNVQIPYELFFQLLQYFLMDNYDGEEIIRLGLEKKLDAMVNREVYSKSKTAPTEEEPLIAKMNRSICTNNGKSFGFWLRFPSFPTRYIGKMIFFFLVL